MFGQGHREMSTVLARLLHAGSWQVSCSLCRRLFLTCVCCITALAQDDEQAFSDDSPPSESAANTGVADLLQEATLHAIGGAYGEAEKCYRQILERTGAMILLRQKRRSCWPT